MALGAERPTVQSPLVRYATQAGWTYLSPDEALRLRRGKATFQILSITMLHLLVTGKARAMESGPA